MSAATEMRLQYRRTRSEQVGVFLRGDWWRIVLLGLFLVGGIAPLVMAFLISLKTIPQFARQPFALTFPLHWENYGFAFEIVLEFLKNSMIISGVTVVGVLLLASAVGICVRHSGVSGPAGAVLPGAIADDGAFGDDADPVVLCW